MTTLADAGEHIDWPDSAASTELRDRLVERPELGQLAALAEWAIGVRPGGTAPTHVRAVVVGADEPSPASLATAETVGAQVRAVPVTEAVDAGVEAGIDAGFALADADAEEGCDLLVVAAPDVAADAAIAVSVLTNTEPVKVLARGVAATDPSAWMATATRVRDVRRACMEHRDDPELILATIGSARLAVLAGILMQAAARRTPVLLDGPVVAAAALVAYEAQPRAVRWWAACDLGAEPMHELALTRLGQRAVLGIGTGLGDGTAGLLTVPVLRAALVSTAG